MSVHILFSKLISLLNVCPNKPKLRANKTISESIVGAAKHAKGTYTPTAGKWILGGAKCHSAGQRHAAGIDGAAIGTGEHHHIHTGSNIVWIRQRGRIHISE